MTKSIVEQRFQAQLAIEELMIQASQDSQNLNTDGSIDWDYVDGDVHMDLPQEVKMLGDSYPAFFDLVADSILESQKTH